MKRKKNVKETVVFCIVIEAVAVLIATVMSAYLYNSRKSVVLTEIDGHTARLQSYMGDYPGEETFRGIARYTEELSDWWESVQREPGYEDRFAVAVSVVDNGRFMFLSGDFLLLYQYVCQDVDSLTYRENVWDLTRYMTEESADAYLKEMKPLWQQKVSVNPSVEEVRGRTESDGSVTPTRVRIWIPNKVEFKEFEKVPQYDTLISSDYREDDDYTWTPAMEGSEEYREVNEKGQVTRWWVEDEFHLTGFTQDKELCKLFDDWMYCAEEGRYVTQYVCFGAAERFVQPPEKGTDTVRTVSRLSGMRSVEQGAEGTVFLLFDVKGIAWDKVKRNILVIFLFAQTFAVMTMIFWQEAKRSRRETKQLRNTFINAMAHELKTPAAVIKSTSEYLATGAKPEKQEHYLGVLVRESDSMNELLNRMLTYTRVTKEGVKLQKSEVLLSGLAQKALSPYEDFIRQRGMKVEFSAESEKTVFCDAGLIQMVLDNLISNAVRYGDSGNTIVIRIIEKRFAIWNQTAPLSKAELKDIFTPMFQTERRKEQSETGGMGLAISAGVLNAHAALYGAYNEKIDFGQNGVTDERDGLMFFFDFKKAPQFEKGRSYAAIGLVGAGIAILAAMGSAFNYLEVDRGYRGSELFMMIAMLFLAIVNAYNYASGKRGPKPIRKKQRTRRI